MNKMKSTIAADSGEQEAEAHNKRKASLNPRVLLRSK